MIESQLGRRNVAPFAKAELVVKLEPLIAARAKERQREAGRDKLPQKSAEAVETRDEAAKMAGMSHDTYTKAKAIVDLADIDRIPLQEFPKLSSRVIAGMCGVSHPFVQSISEVVTVTTSKPSCNSHHTGADGKDATGKAGGRGRKKPCGNLPQGIAPRSRDLVAASVGMSGRTYEKAKAVCGTDDEEQTQGN